MEWEGHERELSGGAAQTTNNQMELTAVIEGLRALKERCLVEIFTDSKYVKDGMESWVEAWKRRGWKTAGKQPVKNVAYWQDLDREAARHEITWTWVKGHSGDPGNDRADELANAEASKFG